MVPEEYLPAMLRVKELFFYRDDVWAEGYARWDESHTPPQKKIAYQPKDFPINLDIIYRHCVEKRITIGAYQFRPDGTVKWICWDVDDDLKREDKSHVQVVTLDIIQQLRLLGLEPHCLIEDSGNKGYHVWLFFAQPTTGRLGQALGLYVRDHVDVPDGIHIEVFPKNERQDGFGNLVKIPFSVHPKTGRQCQLVDTGFVARDSVQAIDEVTPLGRAELAALVDDLHLGSATETDAPRSSTGTSSTGVPSRGLPCTTELLETGVSEGERQEATFRLAYRLKNQGLPEDVASTVLLGWDDGKNTPPLHADDPAEFKRSIENGFKAKGLGCKSDFMRQHCHAECPVYKKIYRPGEGPDSGNDSRGAAPTAGPDTASGETHAEDEPAVQLAPAQSGESPAAPLELRYIRFSEDEGLVFTRGDLEYRAYGHVLTRIRVTVIRAGNVLAIDAGEIEKENVRKRIGKAVHEADPAVSVAQVVQDLLALVIEWRKASQVAARAAGKPSLTPIEEAAAIELLKSPDLVERIQTAIGRLGLVGELENRMLIYVAYTSRGMTEPLGIIMKGESSSGKSFTSKRILQLMPPESYHVTAVLTPQALFHMPIDHLQHRILVVWEYRSDQSDSTQKAEQNLRIGMTEGISIDMPQKNPETGEMTTIHKEVRGPFMFLTTTTSLVIHAENETRMLSLYTSEGQDQTVRIMDARSRNAAGTAPELSKGELDLWQNAQRVLRSARVLIPYAPTVAAAFPSKLVRARRDIDKFFSLVSTFAYLHQYQREWTTHGGEPAILAAGQDYDMAVRYAGPVFLDSLSSMSPAAREALEVIITKYRTLSFTKFDIATAIEKHPTTAYGRIKQLEGAGYLVPSLLSSSTARGPGRWTLAAGWDSKVAASRLPGTFEALMSKVEDQVEESTEEQGPVRPAATEAVWNTSENQLLTPQVSQGAPLYRVTADTVLDMFEGSKVTT